uniref:Uncharacterized protein n=1 Tax=Dulem virus 42 TaxID=3145760 RepID=A0AAU8BAD1_9CAUD
MDKRTFAEMAINQLEALHECHGMAYDPEHMTFEEWLAKFTEIYRTITSYYEHAYNDVEHLNQRWAAAIAKGFTPEEVFNMMLNRIRFLEKVCKEDVDKYYLTNEKLYKYIIDIWKKTS